MVNKDKFSKELTTINLENQVKDELSNTIIPIKKSYMKFGNRQSTFVLSTLEMVYQILSEARIKNKPQKDIVFNLSREIIQKCKDITNDIIPPVDSDLIRPKFLEIHKLFYNLVQYCKVKNIAQNPINKSLDEILSEEQAHLLSQKLLKVKLAP